jgi:hypothetical protein
VSQAVGTRWFRHAGGVRPNLSAAVPGRYLSFCEREDIAVWRAQDAGVREIARRLGRSPSSISRELRRNASTRTYRLDYRASTAQWHAERRARRPKIAKLAADERLRAYVQDRLAGAITRPDGVAVAGPDVRWIGRRHGRRADRRWAASWSPEQIANRLRADFPDDESMRVSHEAIYQALYVQGRGALRREMTACLRTGRALRVPRARTRGRGKKFVVAASPPLISGRAAQDTGTPLRPQGCCASLTRRPFGPALTPEPLRALGPGSAGRPCLPRPDARHTGNISPNRKSPRFQGIASH